MAARTHVEVGKRRSTSASAPPVAHEALPGEGGRFPGQGESTEIRLRERILEVLDPIELDRDLGVDDRVDGERRFASAGGERLLGPRAPLGIAGLVRHPFEFRGDDQRGHGRQVLHDLRRRRDVRRGAGRARPLDARSGSRADGRDRTPSSSPLRRSVAAPEEGSIPFPSARTRLSSDGSPEARRSAQGGSP